MNGNKPGEAIYEALIACVQRNTADDEYLDTMSYLIHKAVWDLTASNEKADQVLALVDAVEPLPVAEPVEPVAEDPSTDA